ncbi:MAG: VOC family protein [Panacibacter sp.]
MHIAELQILTNDIIETENFYNKVLGFSTIEKTTITISFEAGTSKLVFIQSNEPGPTYHFAFNIPCNKVEEALQFINSGTAILPVTENSNIADFNNWNAKAFYFYDNNGNILEFIARFGLNNETIEAFSNKDILSISEIGLVVDNVKTYCNQLRRENNLEYFSRQPASENFTVLGDDNGLLIVVPNGRSWYPTNKPSGKYFTKVKLLNREEVLEITMYENNS